MVGVVSEKVCRNVAYLVKYILSGIIYQEDNVTIASVCFDEGKSYNKIAPNQRFTLKKASRFFLQPPLKKRSNDKMHGIEFHVVEMIQEAGCVKLEDEEVEKEDQGNTNATNANTNMNTNTVGKQIAAH